MKRILELGVNECRWPIAEDRTGHLFCSHRTPDGQSYCPDHKAMSVETELPDWWLELDDLFGVKR